MSRARPCGPTSRSVRPASTSVIRRTPRRRTRQSPPRDGHPWRRSHARRCVGLAAGRLTPARAPARPGSPPRPSPGFFGLRRVGCVVSFALAMDIAELRAKIRDIKDFPTEGILFKDITTLLQGRARVGVGDRPSRRALSDRAGRPRGGRGVARVHLRRRARASARGGLRPGAQAGQAARARRSRRSTSSSTAATSSPFTRTRSGPASACSRWTICSPPVARWRRRSGSSSGWAARSSERRS